MTQQGHTIPGAHGAIRIEGDALASLVTTAAELVDGARVRRPRRDVDVVVSGGRARVELEITARYGAVLPVLGARIQESVAEALRVSAGLEVAAVDLLIEELDR